MVAKLKTEPKKVVAPVKEPEPKWLELARKELGTKEWGGKKSNPVVENYYKDAVNRKSNDAVPWCAAFVGAMLTRSKVKPSGSLMARSYATYGTKLSGPIPGAIAVFSRGRVSGHTGFVTEDAGKSIKVIGGNQSDAVTINTYPKDRRLLGYRWPKDVPVPGAAKKLVLEEPAELQAQDIIDWIDENCRCNEVE